MKRIVLLLSSILMTVAVLANPKKPEVKTVTAECDYIMNPRETLEEARINAIEQAKVQAIANEFGLTMNLTNFTTLSADKNYDSERFNSFAMSDVNGEWIQTISEDVTPIFDKNMTIFHVKIKGKVREIVSNPIELELKILANGTNPKMNLIRDDRLMVGDYLYVYFMSPIDGYLTMYLEDCQSDEKIQALVPYRGMNEGSMKIEANKPYIFFSREDAEPAIANMVGRIKVNARNDIDYNRLYVLFSPNQFVKALDNDNASPEASFQDRNGNTIHRLPREIEVKAFQNWLSKTRLKDPDMQLKTVIFSIEK